MSANCRRKARLPSLRPYLRNHGAVPRKSPKNICADSAYVEAGKAVGDGYCCLPVCLWVAGLYWQAVILVVMTLRQARANGIGANQLMRMFSIPRKTIVRWISYFRDEFAASREWLRLHGRVDATVGNGDLPGGLVEHFLSYCGSAAGGLVACLQFLVTGQVS